MRALQLHQLPTIAVNLLGLNVVICVILAYTKKHVTYVVPYISDTGTYPPESCIFGLLLNIVGFLLAVIIYINYKHVHHIYIKHKLDRCVRTLNNIAFYSGEIAVVGLLIVANFQETNVQWFHWTGALLSFGFGALYQCLITATCLKLYPKYGATKINRIRIFLSVLSTVTFFVFSTTGLIALSQFTGNDPTKWKYEEGGFHLHIVSTVTEWICATSTMVYILTYSNDFRAMNISPLKFETKEDNNVNVRHIDSSDNE